MTDHSSTFNSEQGLSACCKALTSPSVLICLALLLGCEFLVRSYMPASKLPKGGFPNAEVRQQVDQYQREDKVDMLIVGSSVAAVNFPPQAIDKEVNKNYPSFVTFNGGIRGCNIVCIKQGTLQLYLSSRTPRYILYTISPEDLDTSNKTVIKRSQKFVTQLNRSYLSLSVHTLAADRSHLFGFQEHIRAYISSGKWEFDLAKVLVRGHVDMGSNDRVHFANSPLVKVDSELTGLLREFITIVTSMGVRVILLPVGGDSEARRQFTQSSRDAFALILSQLSENSNVTLVDTSYQPVSPLHQQDSAFIDNLHLNSKYSQTQGRATGKLLIDLRVLEDHF